MAVSRSISPGFNYLLGDPLADDLMIAVFGEDAEIVVKSSDFDMFDMLVEIGAFKSRGEAKRNWKKSDKDIDFGCHSFLVSKKLTPLFVFKPIQSLSDFFD